MIGKLEKSSGDRQKLLKNFLIKEYEKENGIIFSELSEREQDEIKKKLNFLMGATENKNYRIMRQRFFIDILKKSGWNVARACQIVGVNRRTYNRWKNNENLSGEGHFDDDGKPITFGELIFEIKEGIKDFIEEKVYERVRRGDPLVTIFAAKTLLKDRGFVERKEIVTDPDGHLDKDRRDAVIRTFMARKGDMFLQGLEVETSSNKVKTIKKLVSDFSEKAEEIESTS